MKHIIKCEKTGRKKVVTVNQQPSKTDQQYKEDCNINNIMRRFSFTGELPTTVKQGQYIDVSDTSDLLSAMEKIEKAKQSFNNLPAAIRTQFNNDPKQFIGWMQDPKNADEAQKYGLITKVQSPDSDKESSPNVNSGAKDDSPSKGDNNGNQGSNS